MCEITFEIIPKRKSKGRIYGFLSVKAGGDAHHADLRGNQVAESVEPVHVGLQVAGLLVIAEAVLQRRNFN